MGALDGERRLRELAESGERVPFHGVDCQRFRLGKEVFEALEDESDGYRSYLGSIEVRDGPIGIFFRRPVDRVAVRRVDEEDGFQGWELFSEDGHAWLRVGTSYTDSCYPTFGFEYCPREPR